METLKTKYPYLNDRGLMATTSNGMCYGAETEATPAFVNGEGAGHDDDDDDSWCGGLDVNSLLQDAPVDSITVRYHVDREESIVDASESTVVDDDGEKVDLDFVDGQVVITVSERTTLIVPLSSSQTDVRYKKLSAVGTRTITIDMMCTANRRRLYSMLQRCRNARGSLDSEQTSQLYRGFKELVEANDQSRKGGAVKPPSSAVSSSFSSSRSRAEPPPNMQVANGAAATAGQRKSRLSSRLTSSNTSPVVSPLTGTLLVPRVAMDDDVASPGVGSHLSATSYSNGPTALTAAGQRKSRVSSRLTSSGTSPVVSPLTGTLLVPHIDIDDDVVSPAVGSHLSATSYSNGPTGLTAAGSRLSSRLTSSSTSPVISPLTGTVLVPRVAKEDDVASSRIGSYSNGPTAESSHIRGTSSSSSPYSSRLTPFTANSTVLSRFDDASDGLASRVLNGGAGGTSRYGDRSPDAASSSYLSGSRLDDASSPAARLQSLRDSYSSTMWNELATSRRDGRLPSSGRTGADGLTSSYDAADPPSELLNGLATTPSRYDRVMSARSRSTGRRGDGGGVLAAPRTRITSPVAAARLEANDLSDVLLSSTAAEQSASARPSPYSASSRAERMRSYGVGTSSKTDPYVRATNATVTTTSPLTSIVADILGTQPPEMTTLPSKRHDVTSATPTRSVTSSLKTSTPVDGTEIPTKTETAQTPAVDKSSTQQDNVVNPSTDLSKNMIMNGGTKTPEVGESRRQQTVTSSLPAGYTNTENDKLAAPTNGGETAASEVKSAASGAASSETDRSRKTDADDIAGASLLAATLNRVHAAAAAAADAAVSLPVRGTMDAVEETPPVSVKETASSEQRTTATEYTDVKGSSDSAAKSLSSSPLRTTSRARSRAPSTLQEMLDPSAGQKNAKSPSTVNQTNDAAGSGSGRKVNDAPSSGKAAKSVDAASKSDSKGGAVTKSRSRKVADVHEMLMPVPSGSGDKTERKPANVASTSSSITTSTSRSRTSSTSSTTEEGSGNVRPAKPSSQTPRKQAPSSSDAASRSGATTADRNSPRRPSASSTSSQAHKVTQPVQERKPTSKMTTAAAKRTSEVASETSMATGEYDWETALTGIIQASTTADTIADDTASVTEQGIRPSTSTSSLQSEPPPSSAAQTRRNSAPRAAGLSSLMRPTASSMARRGSTSGTGAGHASYAAPTSSSSSKSVSPGMLRTASSPTLRLGGTLSLPSRPAGGGTSSGRTTPTSPRRSSNVPPLPAAARATKTTSNAAASTAARTPRPGTTPTTSSSSVQRGAGQTASRPGVISRSRHNSGTSSSGDAATGRK